MKGSGGTEGGVGIFVLGLFLAVLGVYLFFDSVRVTTTAGLISGLMGGGGAGGGGGGGGGLWETTSMGIIFVPFMVGVIALFQDSKRKWAWWILYLGLAVIAVEIISRFRFLMTTKLTHLLGMMVLFGAGVGLMLRSYLPSKAASSEAADSSSGPST